MATYKQTGYKYKGAMVAIPEPLYIIV